MLRASWVVLFMAIAIWPLEASTDFVGGTTGHKMDFFQPLGTFLGIPGPIIIMIALFTLGMLPYAAIVLTSFTKIVIVMSLLRNALGVQQSPPNQAITGIALILSIYVMFPTGMEMVQQGQTVITAYANKSHQIRESPQYFIDLFNATKEPMRNFLYRNTMQKQLQSFFKLAHHTLPKEAREDLSPKDFVVLVPAYVLSQLKNAFEIGVLIYLPFFVIDLVTSNILLAMGMMMLSPLTIALPLKLLLIVMVDGWSLIVHGLVMTYR